MEVENCGSAAWTADDSARLLEYVQNVIAFDTVHGGFGQGKY